MHIYRIQDKFGRGPFKPGINQKWIKEKRSNADFPPFYIEFTDLPFLPGMGCGCKDIETLRKWFSEDEYLALRNLGYEAVKLKVDKIMANGKNQCVFVRKTKFNKGAEVFALYDSVSFVGIRFA